MQDTPVPPFFADLTAQERAALFTDERLRTLPAAFATVPDPRKRRGQRYDLPFLLLCLVAALLCDCNSLEAVGRWTRDHRTVLARVCGPRPHLSPTGSLYRRLLPRLSVAHVERALAGWVQQTRPQRDREPLAGDGKAVRGARTATQAAPHLLSISTHDTHETLVQVRVDDKTNEIPVLHDLLPHLPLRGRVVTADALHTQTALAQLLLDHHAAYLLTVKDNQPRLRAELAAYFTDQQATARMATTVDRRRGRTETRTLRASTRLNAYLRAYFPFPGIAQIAQLTRTVRTGVRTGATTRSETVYLITSLPPRHADPARLLTLIRGHWSVESRHWLRDVTFGEDAARLRTGAAPQIMAAVRNLVITLIRRTGTTQIAAYRQHLRTHPAKALRLLVPKKPSA
jgi:predicted transposase YbfD/YdcC